MPSNTTSSVFQTKYQTPKKLFKNYSKSKVLKFNTLRIQTLKKVFGSGSWYTGYEIWNFKR